MAHIYGSEREDGKKKFEIKTCLGDDGVSIKQAVFIDGIQLDYSVDINAFMEAAKMGMKYKIDMMKDIERHFCSCVSEVLGRNVSIDEVNQARKTGWI